MDTSHSKVEQRALEEVSVGLYTYVSHTLLGLNCHHFQAYILTHNMNSIIASSVPDKPDLWQSERPQPGSYGVTQWNNQPVSLQISTSSATTLFFIQSALFVPKT